ncbi:right-handed parallel beta-helix repeat-containing protein [Dongia sp.]|uniref:right-handed parallel beta-helix repeat-containing protein n=1 Tax=Dongia sp. TaxID=1977262 RepID=UPI0035AE486B
MLLAAGLLKISARHAAASVASGFSPDSQVQIDAAKSFRYVTRKGAGSHDGQDWRNAMPVNWVSKAQAAAAPGAAFLIGSEPVDPHPIELGRKKPQIFLRTSGTKETPIIVLAGDIAGNDSLMLPAPDDAAPRFRNVDPWSVETFGKSKGAPFFLGIERDASHIFLAGFRMAGTSGDGFFKFRHGKAKSASFDGITFADIAGTDIGRVIETDQGAKLSNIVIRDCRAFGIVRGFARFHHLAQSVLRDLDLDANGLDGGAKNVCQLIAVDKGTDILFENITLRNAVSTKTLAGGGEGYTQGDGIVCESGTRNVTIRNCHASNMGDAAFDLKTSGVKIEKSSSEHCKFGARIWSKAENLIRDCTFRQPVTRAGTEGCCIQVSGLCDIVNTTLQVGDGTFALGFNKLKRGDTPVIRMHGGAIELSADGGLARGNATGILELHDVAVNGETRSGSHHLENNILR